MKMGKIFYVMGKSASGKVPYSNALVRRLSGYRTVKMYTTRAHPGRGTQWRGVFFVDQTFWRRPAKTAP